MTSRNRLLLLGAIVAAIVVVAWWLLRSQAASDEGAQAETPVSALVETQPAQQGSIGDVVVAHGTAVAAVNGGMTLSVPADGRVMKILVTPGEAVQAGQPLLEFRLSAAAGSSLQQAVTALKVARDAQARTARLFAEQLATGEQKAQADKAMTDAQSALDALQRETGGKSEQTLTAPFAGVVGSVPVAQGDRIAAGAALVALTRSNGLVVTVGIEPDQRDKLKLGLSAKVVSLSRGGTALNGRLVRIGSSLNPKTRLIDADIAVDDDLLQGDAFRVEIAIGSFDGWVAPRNAVLDDDDGAYLFQVDGKKAVRVNVTRVGSNNETVVVDGPLVAARPVVVVGNYQLEDGMPVRLAEAATKSGTDVKVP